jgi:hypothetical protein
MTHKPRVKLKVSSKPTRPTVVEFSREAADRNVIDQIKGMLEQAEDGDIRAFCSVAMYGDNTCTQGWVGLNYRRALLIAGELQNMLFELNLYISMQCDDSQLNRL